MTQCFNSDMQNMERKKGKWRKNRKIRAMSLSLNSMIQSLIFHMYTKCQNSSFNSFGENSDTKKSYEVTELRNYGQTRSGKIDK